MLAKCRGPPIRAASATYQVHFREGKQAVDALLEIWKKKIIADYLSQKEIVLQAKGKTKIVEISSEVPQGLVLGPTPWNVLYVRLLRTELPNGTRVVGFADNVLLLVTERGGKNWDRSAGPRRIWKITSCWLDTKATFASHIKYIVMRVEKH